MITLRTRLRPAGGAPNGIAPGCAAWRSAPQYNAAVTSASRRVFFAGLALAISGSVFFSGKGVVIKLAYRYGVDPETLIALRMAFAAPFFALVYAWIARSAPPLARGDHLRLIGLGLIGYYASSYLSFLGLQYVSAGIERLILYLNPTLVLLMSAAFLGKRIERLDWMAVATSYCGIALAVGHEVHFEGARTGLGAALVFGSALLYAAYMVMGGELIRRVGAIRLTAHAMLVSTVAVLVQFALLHPPAMLVNQPSQVLWLSFINGFFCTVLPTFAIMMAIDRIGAGNTALAGMVGPVSTIFIAWLALDETVSGWQVAGTVLVLAGVYFLSRKGLQRRPVPAAAPTATTATKEI
jgi:drug/metabolite transporter (DMT)-like permease